MALLLLVLGLSLTRAQVFNPKAIVQKNYNMARISGSWFSISMASDNLTRIEENGDLRVFVRNIDQLKNGSLKFDFHFMILGECVVVNMVCQKKKDGEYSIAYEGQNKVLVSETDYRMYVIFNMQNTKNGTKTRVLALYGRLPQLSHDFVHRFEKVCKRYRLGSRNIMDMVNKDHCYTKR